MNFTLLSFGTGFALACLFLLIVLEIIFFLIKTWFYFFSGAGMIYWCCDNCLVPALEYDGVK